MGAGTGCISLGLLLSYFLLSNFQVVRLLGSPNRSVSPQTTGSQKNGALVLVSPPARWKGLLRLRGGSEIVVDGAMLASEALTESDEARLVGCMRAGMRKDSEQDVSGVEDLGAADVDDGRALEDLTKHLDEVDDNPAGFLPCIRKDCPRFVAMPPGLQGVAACGGCGEACFVSDEICEVLALEARRVWSRLNPLDLVALMPHRYLFLLIPFYFPLSLFLSDRES